MEMKKCPYCGEDILVVAKKCKYCGEWLDETKPEPAVPRKTVCPVCAEEIDEGTEICPYCHERIGKSKEKPAEVICSTAKTSEKSSKIEVKSKHSFNGFCATYFFDILRKHYADFRGTESRKSYWYFILYGMIAVFGVSFLEMLFSTGTFICFYLIISLALCIPTVAIAVRRLHDIGKTGWWILISMVPLVGLVWLLILLSKKGEAKAPDTRWSVFDSLYMIVLALVIIIGTLLLVASGEKYYVYEDSEWIGNNDYSWFFAVATTDKRDIEPSDYIDHYGTQVIVAAEVPDGKMHAVLSSKDIATKNPNVGTDLNYEIFPSTIDPNLIYFNYWENGMEFPSCGKVDCQTGKFDLFNGTIIGMISDGKFDECYIRVDLGIPGITEGVKIYSQSAVGQSATPVVEAFNISQFWRGYSNEELIFDKAFAEQVVEWLENM